jgi:hypothetical protein
MKHLKEKIFDEILCIEHEIEESGTINEDQLALVYRLAKTLYYLEKMSETKNVLANPIPGIAGIR